MPDGTLHSPAIRVLVMCADGFHFCLQFLRAILAESWQLGKRFCLSPCPRSSLGQDSGLMMPSMEHKAMTSMTRTLLAAAVRVGYSWWQWLAYKSVAERLPNVHKGLGLIPSTEEVRFPPRF